MRLKDLCRDEMPREKMMSKGASALSDTELIAILLRVGRNGTNVIDLARELLRSGNGTLSDLAGMSAERLCRISGIGPGKAVAVAAAFELGRRTAVEIAGNSDEPMSSPRKVFGIMQPMTRDLDHEQCWIILLNKANRIISKEIISRGSIDSTVIDNREIIRRAIDKKASGVILVHNHPSGSALPSKADIIRTESLNKALKTFDIALLDHVIIAKREYYSFADEQICENF